MVLMCCFIHLSVEMKLLPASIKTKLKLMFRDQKSYPRQVMAKKRQICKLWTRNMLYGPTAEKFKFFFPYLFL